MYFRSKNAFLIVARSLGPGFNQFQNWNSQNEESSDASEEEEKPEANKKPRPQEDDSEDWTDWKNGEDIRNRFTSNKKPGRIIHLGDGSGLFTDQNVGDEDDDGDEIQNKDMGISSSTDEDSDEEEHDKMQVDGVNDVSKTTSKTTTRDTADPIKTPETRHKSPTPGDTPQPRG